MTYFLIVIYLLAEYSYLSEMLAMEAIDEEINGIADRFDVEANPLPIPLKDNFALQSAVVMMWPALAIAAIILKLRA